MVRGGEGVVRGGEGVVRVGKGVVRGGQGRSGVVTRQLGAGRGGQGPRVAVRGRGKEGARRGLGRVLCKERACSSRASCASLRLTDCPE